MNFFLKRYKEQGHDIDPENIELKRSIRVNTLKISEAELIKRLKNRPEGFVQDGKLIAGRPYGPLNAGTLSK